MKIKPRLMERILSKAGPVLVVYKELAWFPVTYIYRVVL